MYKKDEPSCGLGLDWIGLDWIGLDWIGLDWIGLKEFYAIVSIGVGNIINCNRLIERG